MKKYEFWFAVGSQDLYGPEVLAQVEKNAREMVDHLTKALPYPLQFKTVVRCADDALDLVREANYDKNCAGIITWCHTFSPSKMWARALQLLQKPWCHFATQYHGLIPNDTIDMDFMNLNQAAHGDREHGFIGARLGRTRKIVIGHWREEAAQAELGSWMRSAVAADFSGELRVIRFGDNMREVAVTEGDKIEALIKLGWQVDYWPVGHLVEMMDAVTEEQIDARMEQYRERYDFATDDLETVRYQARIEEAMRAILVRERASAVVTNFQDLYGMKQLPGLAIQNLMADGYGFGAEGDWKTAALTAVVKKMGEGLPGGCSFVEDYSYNMDGGASTALVAHMLEICPTLSSKKAKVEVHPLGIGDREAPARLVFDADAGEATVVTLLDIGGRMRMIIQDVTCLQAPEMPNLPVARILWKPEPDLYTSLKCWIQAGGGHHSVLTNQVGAQAIRDWADIMGLEVLYINKNTTYEAFEAQLRNAQLYWTLR